MTDLTIANTVTDLIQGDVNEHLAYERIPLKGDVLGLGTTTSLDNGELTFLPDPTGDTAIWKCEAFNGGIRRLHRGMAVLISLMSVSPGMPQVCATRWMSSSSGLWMVVACRSWWLKRSAWAMTPAV